jgi:hypothetical protein
MSRPEPSPMRRIEVLDRLHLQFPNRDAEFDLGIAVGSLAVLMAQGQPSIRRTVTGECVEQLRPIAERFRYALVATPESEGLFALSLDHLRQQKPRLRLVSSAG